MNNNSGGVGLFTLTFIVFLTLKLCGTIDWSWWWVMAPLWGPLALIVAAFFVIWLSLICIGWITDFHAWLNEKDKE
jgi:hypothetical protein